MKRPTVIEFSGLPNSGKTTLLQNIAKRCESNNISAIIMQETAELLPKDIPKGTIEQNLWITLETVKKSLEMSFLANVDFILLDRGFYDQLFWVKMYAEKDEEYGNFVLDFMTKFSKRYEVQPDYLYIVDVGVEESIKRRMATGEPVTFSKQDFLREYKNKFETFSNEIDSKLYIDTTNMDKDEVADIVFSTIISLR